MWQLRLRHGPVLFHRLANRSLVTPALADRYRYDSALPPALRPFFMTITTRSVHRNTVMRAQMVEAGIALNKAGIVPLAFKGAALLAQHSLAEGERVEGEGAAPEGLVDGPADGLANRIFADIDLMVPARQLASAIAALGSLRYTLDGEPGIHGAALSGTAMSAGSIFIPASRFLIRTLITPASPMSARFAQQAKRNCCCRRLSYMPQ